MTVETLREQASSSSRTSLVKILGRGELTKALTVHAHKFSGKAAEKVAAAGGTDRGHPGRPVAVPDAKA